MPGIEEYKPESRFCALFAGQSGCGKSSAAASFPEPYHELDTDGRFAGIYGASKKGLFKNTKISYKQFPRLGGWVPIDHELTQLVIYKSQSNTNTMKFPYATIGLGSLGSLCRALGNMARKELKGQVVGSMRLPAPGDSRVENTGVHTVIDTLKDMPCNIICTAHIIEKWGKPPLKESGDEYKPNIIIGEKLNFNDNLSSSIMSEFDDIYRFERKIINSRECYFVQFCTDFAKNSFGIPPGEFDITDKEFYPWFLNLRAKAKETRKFDELVKVQ